uniref:DRBM domain-containing protein n=1 Tax=Anopheles culicifacies TaxID=139723 RepID=A0A182MIP4_9DIPT
MLLFIDMLYRPSVAATGTTYNDSYEQYISVSAGGGTTTVTASTGTTLKTATAAIITPLATSHSPSPAIIPKHPAAGDSTRTTTNHATTNNTATILMLPLAGYVMSPGEPLLTKPHCTKPPEQRGDAKPTPPAPLLPPHEAAATYKKLKAKNAKAAAAAAAAASLATNCPLSAAAGDFHRFVNYLQYDSFMLNGSKKQSTCHNNYFNKFGHFDTPINSYLSLVRNDGSTTKLTAKAIAKEGTGRQQQYGGDGGGGGGGTVASNTGMVGIPAATGATIANGGSSNSTTAAIVIVTSPTSVITTHTAGGGGGGGSSSSSSSTGGGGGVGGDKGYGRDCPASNTVSYPFPNTATIPPNLTPYAQNELKVSSGTALRNSGNVASGHHPKPQPEKGPVMLLHELFTDAHFECVSSDGLQHSKFTVVVTVNDNQRFEGTGPSKKMAKNAAAKAALASICNISFSPLQQSKFGLISAGTSNGAIGGPSGVALNGDNSFTQNKNFELPQTFADAVG